MYYIFHWRACCINLYTYIQLQKYIYCNALSSSPIFSSFLVVRLYFNARDYDTRSFYFILTKSYDIMWIEPQSYSHSNVQVLHMVGSNVLGFRSSQGPICQGAFLKCIMHTILFHKQPFFPVAVCIIRATQLILSHQILTLLFLLLLKC